MAEQKRIKGPDGEWIDVAELSSQNVREHWNEYFLDDGTVLKLKPVATEVYRVEGKYDSEGNPIYFLQSRNILVVKAPAHLKKAREDGIS